RSPCNQYLFTIQIKMRYLVTGNNLHNMFATKNPIVVLVLLFISCISYAQTVKVTEDNERIKGRNGNGYRIDLEASKAEVLTALPKFLRSVGRIRQDDDQFTVSNPSINGITYNGSLYAVARGDEK